MFFARKFREIWPFDLCSILDILKFASTSICRQFFSKICKTDFELFVKYAKYHIFLFCEKSDLQIFILFCMNVYLQLISDLRNFEVGSYGQILRKTPLKLLEPSPLLSTQTFIFAVYLRLYCSSVS